MLVFTFKLELNVLNQILQSLIFDMRIASINKMKINYEEI